MAMRDRDMDERLRRGVRRDDADDEPRRGGRRAREDASNVGAILAIAGISGVAVILFIVGLVILINAINKKKDGGGGPVDPPGVAFDQPPPPPPPLTLDQALRHIEAGDVSKHHESARLLTTTPVQDKRRAEVMRILKAAIDKRQPHSPRFQLVEALCKWASTADVPYLATLVDDADGNIRITTMFTLGQLKDGRAAEAVAKRLVHERREASDALKNMGPAAEKAVAQYLGHADYGLRIEACHILKVIGTAASHPALIKLAWDDNQPLADAALAALPKERRPPIYGPAQTILLNIHVPDVAAWPAIEKKLRALTEGEPVMCKYGRSGEYMSVRLAPVTADPAAFAARLTFATVGAIHQRDRLIYLNQVK